MRPTVVLMVALVIGVLAVSGQACSTANRYPDGLRCVRGHDEIVNDSGLTEFVCDEYEPTTTVAP